MPDTLLACEPICTLEEKTGIVKVVFSFRTIDPEGELVELSWTDTHPQENGKRFGEPPDQSLNQTVVPLAFVAALTHRSFPGARQDQP